MKLDQMVLKRLEELDNKVEEIGTKKTTTVYMDETFINSEMVHAWATSVMNILKKIFGEDSAHYQNFCRHYKNFNGYDYEFDNCKGVFKAAKEDYEGGYLFNLKSLITPKFWIVFWNKRRSF